MGHPDVERAIQLSIAQPSATANSQWHARKALHGRVLQRGSRMTPVVSGLTIDQTAVESVTIP